MEMKDLMYLQRREANKRIDTLISKFNLNPCVRDFFNEGKLYYSYITGLMIGSIDTIEYDPRYAQVVKEFEERTHSLVYHAIETGWMLALLYVSKYPEDWPMERLKDDCIMAYVYNFDFPEWPDIGNIFISGYMKSGCLIRTG